MTSPCPRIVVAAAFVFSATTLASAQTPVPAAMFEPNVQLALFSIRADGSRSGYAGPSLKSDDTIEASTVYVSGCSIGATSSEAPASATDVWKVSGRVVSRMTNGAVVQVDWQRVRAAGQPVASSMTSTQLTVVEGTPIPIDSATVTMDAGCEVRTASLELRFAPFLFTPPPGSRGGGGVVRIGSAQTPSGRVTVTTVGAGRSADGTFSDPRFYTADLWLVHSAAGAADVTTHTSTVASLTPGQFAFAPVVITLPSGTVSVQISGSAQISIGPQDERRLVTTVRRQASFSPANRPPRDPATSQTSGESGIVRPIPQPDAVLSFEIPPVQVPGGPSVPDRFELRVRLTPLAFTPSR